MQENENPTKRTRVPKYKNKVQRRKALNRATNKWNKENSKCVAFSFINEKDKDIIDKFNSVENKGDYIRRLIREDLAKESS